MEKIQKVASNIAFRPLSRYGLTRFFLLSVVAELVKYDDNASKYLKNPKMLFDTGGIDKFVEAIETILQSIIVDLNYEIEDLGDQFDYKGDLKSPKKIQELRNKLLRSYEKDVARNKADSLANLIS